MILNYPGQDLLKVYGCQQGVHGGIYISELLYFNTRFQMKYFVNENGIGLLSCQ